MFTPELVEIVGYQNGAPVLRITRHGGGGTFTSLYCVEELYSRATYRGGGARGSRQAEDEMIAHLEPVLPGYRLQLPHRITAAVNGCLEELQDAIAQVDDERVPLVVDSTLDTRPEPSLWCDEWDRLWKDAMWDASLTLSEQLGADIEPDLTRALARVDMGFLAHPGATGTVCLILPSAIDFCMVLRLRRMCIHNEGRQATHLPVVLEGLPGDRFIAGMLELRERIVEGDRQAEEQLVAACGEADPTLLLEAEESDMLGALLALSLGDSYDERVAQRLRAMEPPWAACGRTVG
ncbi:MAG: hypothetical protein ACOX9R_08395 [Armatimonadota bacterium]|jgi:hypothetical protein